MRTIDCCACGVGHMSSTFTFCLAISHTPWVPERVASLGRLGVDLDLGVQLSSSGVMRPQEEIDRLVGMLPQGRHLMPFRLFGEKAPNHVWSLQMWTWASEQDCDWCVFLQDDAVVAPDFWERLEYIVEGSNFPIIGLQSPHPAAPMLAEEGCYEGFTTTDGLIGVGYAVQRADLLDFLAWRLANLDKLEAELPDPSKRDMADGHPPPLHVTEDTLLGMYAAAHCDVYHPLPTIVDHDTTIPSVCGNDAHRNRRSTFRWDHPLAQSSIVSTVDAIIPHLGRFYPDTAEKLAKYTHTDASTIQHVASDTGDYERRRIHYAKLGRRHEPLAKVFIATPTRGEVSAGYARSVWRLIRDESIDLAGDLEICDAQIWLSDIVRVRNRFVWHFLHNTDATHLLFLDSDVEVSPAAVRGMIACGVPFVATPYPRRGGVNWHGVAESVMTNPGQHPEAAAYTYSVHVLKDALEIDNVTGRAEVAAVPLGCALLRREELQAHWDAHVKAGLTYEDILPTGARVPAMANLFGLVTVPDGGLLSEDYSFCHGWRTDGGTVYLYMGPGSPANHYGAHNYVGHIAAFGIERVG